MPIRLVKGDRALDVSLTCGRAPAATAAPGLRAAAGERIRFLDVLRATAAVSVLLQHALERASDTGRAIVDALSPGVFGVVLFFVISCSGAQ
jgi:hypothetical protein